MTTCTSMILGPEGNMLKASLRAFEHYAVEINISALLYVFRHRGYL